MSWAADEFWRFDDITVACNDCILPVNFSHFSAQQEAQNVLLSWATLSERDNAFFIVERGNDNIQFEPIGKVEGMGNSSTETTYQFIDKGMTKNGPVYYRLAQVDYNGKINYSPIISHLHENVAAFYSANSQLHYALNNSNNKTYQLNIYAITGELLHQEIIQNSGSFPWQGNGIYILEIPALNYVQKIVLTN